jgi:histidinol-phosphatase (PHP family)
MCVSQIEKGTKIFAVTNHCDVYSYNDYDIYTPLEECHKAVKLLNKKYGDKCLILSGVEISEGFWFTDEYKKAHALLPYDVIIGSVHCVKYKNLDMAYSKIDFSKLSEKTIYEFLDCYFNDMIEMLEFMDFDILAHLTCPLRYINGKYKINIGLERFNKKISEILNIIIDRKIALEVNTSSYDILNDFMPSKKIIKQYYNMGGRLITLGSDAHIAENASNHFDKAVKTIKEIGFENICYFQNRKVNKIKI